MVTALLFSALALSPVQGESVTLARKFNKGDKFIYDVKSTITVEQRQEGLDTFIPSDTDLTYSFTTEVVQMKADGIAVVRYKRPTVTVVTGEGDEGGPQTLVEKPNDNLLLTVSPANEIMDMKEAGRWHVPARFAKQADPIVDFIGDLTRLALFSGSFDNALDFTPKLPFTPVKPGDTWSRTVSYQPQKLKGTSKTVVQRLDYHYTFKGPVTVNGKKFNRVEAKMDLSSDLAAFANQYANEDDSEQFETLAKLPVQMKAKIEYDLDPKTGHTVAARAESEGGFQIALAIDPSKPAFEQKMKGRTTMRLRPAPAPPKTPVKAPAKPVKKG